MKKRPVVKLENFLLISGVTAAASVGSLMYSWFVLPTRTVIDTCNDSKDLCDVLEKIPDVYTQNITKLSMTPFIAYAIARGIADRRLKEHVYN